LGAREAPAAAAAQAFEAQTAESQAAEAQAAEAQTAESRAELPCGARAPNSSISLDPLSPLARRYFEELPGAGAMSPAADVVQGSAGGPAAEAWVRFHLQLDRQGSVKNALFQAYGCPHTLAVTAWVNEQLPGRSMSDLVPGTPSAWLQALSVPVEKLGRLLVVEDALRAAFQQWSERI
jgi:NifU-like protein involved in Fe-S cluster formation